LSVAAAFVPTRTDTRAAAGHDRYCSRHGGPIGIGIVHLIRTVGLLRWKPFLRVQANLDMKC
jgi:hypothetical protein